MDFSNLEVTKLVMNAVIKVSDILNLFVVKISVDLYTFFCLVCTCELVTFS